MAERKWTEAQRAAIEERSKTLLVSAAAGSGKTATLTERIIRTLTEENHPGEISRMLVVTFTRASAADLRQKIASALQAAMASGKHKAHLSRQLLLLPGAAISTIDSFSMNLVRENAAALGLSPAFRMVDAAEGKLLLSSVMTRAIEDGYEGSLTAARTGAEFAALVDCLVGPRGDSALGDILLRLYRTTGGFVRRHHVLGDMAKELGEMGERPFLSTRIGAYATARTRDMLQSYRSAYEAARQDLLAEDPGHPYLPSLEEEHAAIEAMLAVLETGDYSATRAHLQGFARAGTKAYRGEKSEATEAALALRHGFWPIPGQLADDFFAYEEADLAPMFASLADKVGLLYEVLSAFHDRLEGEKKRRNICDFSDLTHGALRLLYDEKGHKTPLCHEIAARYDYVYIDEYQDVNEVQHKLFEALASPHGRFMVGDVKQSIYSFRGAQPEIFAALRLALTPLSRVREEENAASLSLSANFRSTSLILRFANMVFGGMMRGVGESIGYDHEEDALVPGLGEREHEEKVTLALFEKKKGKATEEQDKDDEDEVDEGEVAYVADEIVRLLQNGLHGRPLLPGDIAIMTRTGKMGDRFAAALSARCIKVDRAAKNGFFLNPEILLAISLLNVVDNPRRDVYLAGLLRSPLYRFTMDDLVLIRRESESEGDRGGTLYEALLAYVAHHPDFEKGSYFLSELSSFRAMAESMPLDRLIWQLYQRTGLLAISGADKSGAPGARRANLMLLYDYARRFEGTSFSGLYNFIDYLNEVIARDERIEEGSVQADSPDSVHIMTIHQSKGLEYPVCFLVGCEKKSKLDDATAPLLFHNAMGCAMKLRDESGFARIANPVYNAIGRVMIEKQLEEEMRVLYVALTRPREKLYLTATLPNCEKALLLGRRRGARLGKTEVYACRSYAEMLFATMDIDKACYELVYPQAAAPLHREGQATEVKEQRDAARQEAEERERQEAEACLSARFAYTYPYKHLSHLPGKLSVSRLHPTVLDEGEGITLLPTTPAVEGEEGLPPAREVPLPLFLGGERPDKAARAGTATHLFMQFCDFARLRAEGAEAELSRLRASEFLGEEEAALVRQKEIEAFRKTPLCRIMAEGEGQIYRELRFHVRLPASAFTGVAEKKAAYEGESVLVQGVMDAVILRPNGEVWLIDYKTDRLTREERKNERAARQKLISRHARQLTYYALACRDMFSRLPDRILLYSLHLGAAIEVGQEELQGEALL